MEEYWLAQFYSVSSDIDCWSVKFFSFHNFIPKSHIRLTFDYTN